VQEERQVGNDNTVVFHKLRADPVQAAARALCQIHREGAAILRRQPRDLPRAALHRRGSAAAEAKTYSLLGEEVPTKRDEPRPPDVPPERLPADTPPVICAASGRRHAALAENWIPTARQRHQDATALNIAGVSDPDPTHGIQVSTPVNSGKEHISMSESIEGAAREMGGRMQQAVGDAIGDTKTAAAGLYNQAAGQAQQQAAKLGDVIKDQPLVAVLIALGIGYLLGRLTAWVGWT
jgi:uncharacterized protein YjbJ (UPF0337 family)